MHAINCPSCGQRLQIPNALHGQSTTCPTCNGHIDSSLTTPQSSRSLSVAAPPVATPPIITTQSHYGLQKLCPFCSEAIAATALKCKHCGETIDVALRSAEEAKRAVENSSQRQSPVFVNTNVGSGGGGHHHHYHRRGTNHVLHAILTVVTCGAWLPVWIICAIIDG